MESVYYEGGGFLSMTTQESPRLDTGIVGPQSSRDHIAFNM